ncbi:hypothetical protein A2U01_0097586, partial [Trifolium medium]|nr:hypothetical protein [Trifolium medium]
MRCRISSDKLLILSSATTIVVFLSSE